MTTTERPLWQGRVRGSPELIRRLSASINDALGDTGAIRTVELDTPEPAAVGPEPVEPPEPASEPVVGPEPVEPAAVEPVPVVEPEPVEPPEPASEPVVGPEPVVDLGIPAELADIVVERALVSILSVGAAGLIAGIGIATFFVLRAAWLALRVTLIVGASIFGARVIAKQVAELPAGPGVARTSRQIWGYTRYVVR